LQRGESPVVLSSPKSDQGERPEAGFDIGQDMLKVRNGHSSTRLEITSIALIGGLLNRRVGFLVTPWCYKCARRRYLPPVDAASMGIVERTHGDGKVGRHGLMDGGNGYRLRGVVAGDGSGGEEGEG
jgi:hypothetical protein